MYESVYNHFLGTQFESAALALAFTIDASISTRRRSEMFLRDEKASESAHLGPAWVAGENQILRLLVFFQVNLLPEGGTFNQTRKTFLNLVGRQIDLPQHTFCK